MMAKHNRTLFTRVAQSAALVFLLTWLCAARLMIHIIDSLGLPTSEVRVARDPLRVVRWPLNARSPRPGSRPLIRRGPGAP
jgi:hypothetical protein